MTKGPQERRFISVATRLAATTVVVLAVACVGVVIELTRREREHLIDAKRTAASMVTDLFAVSMAPALDFKDNETIETDVQALRSNAEVVYASVWDASADKPIAELATADAASPDSKPSEPNRTLVGKDHIDALRAVRGPDGKLLGFVLLRFSLARENARYTEGRNRILLYSALLTGGIALLLIAVSRRTIVTPLGRLVAAARGLEQGERRRVDVAANDEVGRLGGAFNAMAEAIADREQRLADARARLQQLLDNMVQGIVVFSLDGTIEDERSRRTDVLFGAGASVGRTIADVLYPDPDRTDVDRQVFDEWLRVASEIDPEAWNELAELAPREVTLVDRDGEEQVLALEFRPVIEDSRITRMMLLATDVTTERRLLRTVELKDAEHKQQIAAMRRLVAGGGQLFVRFLDGARDRVRRTRPLIESAETLRRGDVELLFQAVHTLKGESRAFDLSQVETELGAIEAYLSELRSPVELERRDRDGGARAWLREAFERLAEALDETESLFVQQSPIGRAVLDQATVSREDVLRLYALASTRKDEVGQLAARLAARPFGESTMHLADAVPRWAEQQGKAARLELEGREVPIAPELSKVLSAVLTHLVRNALAHGIEPPEARAAAAKPPVGLIRVTAEPAPPGAVIVVEDDGAGFDLRALDARASALGLSTVGLDAALEPGVSTTTAGDDLAGYGVGLAAVKAELGEAGYEMAVSSTPGCGSRIVLRSRQ